MWVTIYIDFREMVKHYLFKKIINPVHINMNKILL